MQQARGVKAAIEVESLLDLAREKSIIGRQSLVNAISDLFEGGNEELSDRERTLMKSILHQLVRDTEKEVRKAIAERFAGSRLVSNAIAKELANDEIEVAYPILKKSDLLRDLDLIEVIRTRTFEHQLVISQRQRVSEVVSEALVDTERERVIVSLLKNVGAKISRRIRERLVDQSRTVSAYQDPLLRRSDLDDDLARRMFDWVSAALRTHIVEKYALDKDQVDDLLERLSAMDQYTVGPGGLTREASEELAADLNNEGAITPDLLAQCLRDGEVGLFETLLWEATRLRKRLISRILFEPGGEGLAIILKALECPKGLFKEIFISARSARLVDEADLQAEAEIAVTFFAKLTMGSATKVLARWRRNEDFLAVLRDIET